VDGGATGAGTGAGGEARAPIARCAAPRAPAPPSPAPPPPPPPTLPAAQAVVDVRAEKKVRVAINGFGRIGRNFLRCWEGRSNSLLDVVAINDSGGVKQASHLLKYDSTLGKFDAEVKIVDDSTLSVNGKNIKVVSSRDPTQLPWKDMNIDLVIEGTGVFLDTPGAGKHLQAGAKKVLITAPAKGSDIPTYVIGVNDGDYKHSDAIISNASCTTNCLAPFVKVRAGGARRRGRGADGRGMRRRAARRAERPGRCGRGPPCCPPRSRPPPAQPVSTPPYKPTQPAPTRCWTRSLASSRAP
jgi:hypothetical protein